MILGGVSSLWLFNRIAYGNIKLVGSDSSYREFIVFEREGGFLLSYTEASVKEPAKRHQMT